LSRTTVRLTDVKTYTGASLVADYSLTYQISSGTSQSRLSSVQLCDGAASPNCLPATTFTWQDTALGFTNSYFGTSYLFNSLTGGGSVAAQAGCGSGLLCGVYRGLYRQIPNGPGLIALDLNGDGKTDFVQQEYNAGFLYLITYLSNGNGGFTINRLATGAGFDSMG
jgi:hypothetical protein